ncbi:MAG: class II aldolase/adducin family protein [Paracoccaceae bacterium]
MTEQALRAEIVAAIRELDATGLNRGSSGNISARSGDAMLITPSSIPALQITPDMLARVPLDATDGRYDGPLKPSTEWRFHQALLRTRPELNAVVHSHAPFATILAIARKPIPAIHYMMAAFGGSDIRCSGYACYGTAALAAEVITAMEGRKACLLANHGMVAAEGSITRAMWLTHELEALAHQYYHVLQIGGGHVLTEGDLAETLKGFSTYRVQDRKG